MDSYALTYALRPSIAVTVDYGQKPAEAEIAAATILTDRLNIRHELIKVDLSHLGSGDLNGDDAIDVAPSSDWWPFRNQALITIAAMRLVGIGVDELLVAAVASDSTHTDGTRRFFELCDELLAYQEGKIRVRAPAIKKTTAELIRESAIPMSLLAWSHSCHTSNIACGRCRGCTKSREVAEELGLADP